MSLTNTLPYHVTSASGNVLCFESCFASDLSFFVCLPQDARSSIETKTPFQALAQYTNLRESFPNTGDMPARMRYHCASWYRVLCFFSLTLFSIRGDFLKQSAILIVAYVCTRPSTNTDRVRVSLFLGFGFVIRMRKNKQHVGPPAAFLNTWKQVLGAYIRSRQFAEQMTRIQAQEARLCTASPLMLTLALQTLPCHSTRVLAVFFPVLIHGICVCVGSGWASISRRYTF